MGRFFFFKKLITLDEFVKSNFFLEIVIIFENLFFLKLSKTADPTRPVCPAKKILELFNFI